MKALKRILRILVLIVLMAGLFVLLIRAVIVGKEAKNVKTEEQMVAQTEKILSGEMPKYDAIIVLGCSVKPDRTPSQMLKNRLDEAVSLWRLGIAECILVTGDHRVGEYDETDIMAEYLVQRNVPNEKIDRDYYGFSTYESMYNAANEYQLHNAIVITQQYHIYRAMYIADSYEMTITGVAAANVGGFFERLKQTVREIGACLKDINYCYQKKEFTR